MKLTTRGQYGALFLDSDGYLIQLPELNAVEPVGGKGREGGWVGGRKKGEAERGSERQRECARQSTRARAKVSKPTTDSESKIRCIRVCLSKAVEKGHTKPDSGNLPNFRARSL